VSLWLVIATAPNPGVEKFCIGKIHCMIVPMKPARVSSSRFPKFFPLLLLVSATFLSPSPGTAAENSLPWRAVFHGAQTEHKRLLN
jgi:hypothetical protein